MGCGGKSLPGQWGQTELTSSTALALPSSMALDKSSPLPLQDEAKEPLSGVIVQIQPSAPGILCLLRPTHRRQLPGSFSPFSHSGLDSTGPTYVLGMWCKQVQPRWLSQEVFGTEIAAILRGFPSGKRAVAVLQLGVATSSPCQLPP